MIQPQPVRDGIAAVLASTDTEVRVVHVAVQHLLRRRRAHDRAADTKLGQVDAERATEHRRPGTCSAEHRRRPDCAVFRDHAGDSTGLEFQTADGTGLEYRHALRAECSRDGRHRLMRLRATVALRV